MMRSVNRCKLWLLVVAMAAVGGLGLACCCRKAACPVEGARAATPQADVWVVGTPYLCRRAKGPISIDAQDHPEQWQHAMIIRGFLIPITHAPAESETIVRMLWDDENLYVQATARDTDLRGTLTGPTARLWTEDAVELFLKPPDAPGQQRGYYEFEISPTNVLLDLAIPIGRRTSYEERAAWESGAPTAVAVKGTIEKPQDADESYRAVMAIPWKSLSFAGGKPPRPGEAWKFILARCDLSRRYGREQELSACIPLPKVDFHMYEIYPQIRFEK